MALQDLIESFQRMVFAHFRHSANNECRISSLVPLVKESWGIYRFITSMLRAMHRRTDDVDALEPLRQRFKTQHYGLRKFYYECSNLRYLTGLINVPKLGQVSLSQIVEIKTCNAVGHRNLQIYSTLVMHQIFLLVPKRPLHLLHLLLLRHLTLLLLNKQGS